MDNYCKQKLSIPEDSYKNIFPDREVTVKDFLALKLPKERFGLVNPLASTCFSTIAANDTIRHLAARELPSRNFVEAMRKEFGQALLDSAVSVDDPSYKNSRLPLWSVQYWHEMYSVVDSQSQWRRCLSWLDSNMDPTATLPAVQEARLWLLALPWNGEMNIPGALTGTTTLAFGRLLGEEEISGTLIDIMASYLSTRILDEDSTTVIEQLRFMRDIEKAESGNHHAKPLTKFLKRLEEQFKDGISQRLYFPAHFKQQRHRLSFKIDFERRQLAYGESLDT